MGRNPFMKSLLLVIALVTSLNFMCPPVCSAKEDKTEDTGPHITDIILTTSQDYLLLFCSIKNSFTPEMIEGIHNGIPVTFTFHINLDRIKTKWFDEAIKELTLQHTLSFDSLKEEYQIVRSEKQTNPTVTDSIDKAIEIMAEVNGLRIIDRDELIPDARYALHVKAKLAEKTLPLYMHYIIPFISMWDFETDWRTIEFQY